MRTINYFLIGSSCFFVVMLNIDFMFSVASSSWLEDKAKTPAGKAEQMRPRRSASDEEAHRPRKAKPCTEINSGVTSSPAHVSNLFVFRLDW